MLKTFVNSLPPRSFWIANCLFWLILNSMAATNSYRMNLHFERPANWFALWFEYLPWWGNWIIVAPIVIATTQLLTFDAKKIPSFLLKTVGIMIVVLASYWCLTLVEVALLEHGKVTFDILSSAFARLMLSPLHMDLLVYLAVLFSGYSFTYYQRSRLHAKRNKELSQQLLQVELMSLKSQLNPHFLFNTLNTIASLIRLDNKNTAIKALSELSAMLRTVLENQRSQMISLEQEVRFIQSYLTIQHMRFEHKLTTEIVIDPDCLSIDIPFMLLQPLVENAVQHGAQLASDKNEVKLNIQSDAEYLQVKLVNKIPEKDEHQGFGIGLSNCRKRLEMLYQDQFELNLTPLSNGYFETFLSMPIQETMPTQETGRINA